MRKYFNLLKNEKGSAPIYLSIIFIMSFLLIFQLYTEYINGFKNKHKTAIMCDAGAMAGVSMAQMDTDLVIEGGLLVWVDAESLLPLSEETLVLDREEAVKEALNIMNLNKIVMQLDKNETEILGDEIDMFVAEDRDNWKDVSLGKDAFTRGNTEAYFKMRIPILSKPVWDTVLDEKYRVVYNAEALIKR